MIKPVPILVIGPSGAGKSSIVERLLGLFPDLERFKTITTRPARPDYDNRIIVTEDEFKKLIDQGELIEWAQIHGQYYGAKKQHLKDILERGRYPIADIDVVGAKKYSILFPNLLKIFITYESLDILPRRLRETRPGITNEEIQIRLNTAKSEMKEADKYDNVVLNKENMLDETIDKVSKIIENKLHLKQRIGGE